MNHLKKYVPLGFAVIFAVLASISAYRFLQDRSSVTQAAPIPTMPVVVATETVGIGEKLSAANLKEVTWPSNLIPTSSFRSAAHLIGRTVRVNLGQNEPIVEAKLLKSDESFSNLIPPHMRAVTVPIRNSQAMAQILDRGTIVDVLSLFQYNNSPVVTAETIVEKARVLGVHKSVATGPRSNKPVETMEVTLIVTPEEAKRVVSTMNQSVVELIVRNEV